MIEQLLSGEIHPLAVQVLHRRFPVVAVKEGGKARHRQRGLPGDLLQRQRIGDSGPHELLRSLQPLRNLQFRVPDQAAQFVKEQIDQVFEHIFILLLAGVQFAQNRLEITEKHRFGIGFQCAPRRQSVQFPEEVCRTPFEHAPGVIPGTLRIPVITERSMRPEDEAAPAVRLVPRPGRCVEEHQQKFSLLMVAEHPRQHCLMDSQRRDPEPPCRNRRFRRTVQLKRAHRKNIHVFRRNLYGNLYDIHKKCNIIEKGFPRIYTEGKIPCIGDKRLSE